MRPWILTLALTSALLAAPASAQDASQMSVADFRQRPEQARTYMVLGAIALTGKLEIVCPRPIAVGEWTAGLMFKQVDVKRPWIDVLIELMDERGCAGQPVKADT